MKCYKCNKQMKYVKGMDFNGYKVNGHKCACGVSYMDPDDAQRVLILNKLKKEKIRAKLGKIRSNLILRLPISVETALNLHKGGEVLLEVESNTLKITPV